VILLTRFCKLLTRVATQSGGARASSASMARRHCLYLLHKWGDWWAPKSLSIPESFQSPLSSGEFRWNIVKQTFYFLFCSKEYWHLSNCKPTMYSLLFTSTPRHCRVLVHRIQLRCVIWDNYQCICCLVDPCPSCGSRNFEKGEKMYQRRSFSNRKWIYWIRILYGKKVTMKKY